MEYASVESYIRTFSLINKTSNKINNYDEKNSSSSVPILSHPSHLLNQLSSHYDYYIYILLYMNNVVMYHESWYIDNNMISIC